MKKILVFSLVLVILLTALTSCFGDDEADTTDGTTAPVTTTSPETTTEADTTTKSPETTTENIDTTTGTPGTTTETPDTTTEAPGTTTEAPGTTTEAPETTTKAPETTTEPPETTTEPEETLYTVEFYANGEYVGEGHFPAGYILMARDYPALPTIPGYKFTWPKVVVGEEDMRVEANCEDDNSTPVHPFN